MLPILQFPVHWAYAVLKTDRMVSLASVACQLLLASVTLVAAKWFYEAFFSPLRNIPGPGLAKLTDAWRSLVTAQHKIDIKHRELHRQYGSAVRIGPNCVSIDDPSLIRTIYATRNPWLKARIDSFANEVAVGLAQPWLTSA